MATSDADQYPGTAHGKSSPVRWDTSTAAGALVLGALALLVWVNISFTASANISKG